LSLTVFEKMPLIQALTSDTMFNDPSKIDNQLNLFDS